MVQQKVDISRVLPRVFAVCLGVGCSTGCGEGDADSSAGTDGATGEGGSEGADGDCLSNEAFFEKEVQAILQANCQSCHNVAGQAKETEFILETSAVPDYLERNLAVFSKMSKLQYEGTPWIILKPTGQMEHQGGLRFEMESPEHLAFLEMIERLEDPVECESEEDVVGEFFDGVDVLGPVATLRKASLLLVGRVPTADELEAVEAGGMDALDGVLGAMMREEAFYAKVRDVYNDQFLTRRYHSSNPDSAIDLLSRVDFPQADYWDDSEVENAWRYANDAIAEEPLRLIEYILRNDLPYTEVLTADYTVVNPYSAKVYGVEPKFKDPNDPGEFVKAKIPGLPHAGIPTMVTYLSRWTTTRTNRNRARSRRFQEFFLATDVLALGTRPTDASGSAYDNPTMNDANCVSCHTAVDPIAGTFANFDDMGRYRPQGHPLRGANVEEPELLDVPETGWYPDMRPPGFKDKSLPSDWASASLQWLGQQAVQDDLFALGPVHLVYEGLFGRRPLVEPSDPMAPGFLEGVRAAKVQRAVFQDIAEKFAASNYDLRVVFRELVKSPFFRAYNASVELTPERELELANVGLARWLTPEELHAKIMATTDVVWGPLENPHLLDRDEFLILYGGINSDDVVDRAYDASGTSANIAKRMANEVACSAVAYDFSKPAVERMLFPYVDQDDGPGIGSSDAEESIRDNIVYLHWHLLGESLTPDDPEIDRTYDLWMNVFDEGVRGLEAGEYQANLPGPCQATVDPWTQEPVEFPVTGDESFTIRSWIAVTSYLLTDYKFLHE